jgi:DNA-binding LacI/PurR family transcriptional regulator
MSDVSITDIARAAGVAPSTVSRALQNHPRISPERCAAIQALAREMGYRPSQVARSLVTGRTQALGVVVTDVTDPFVAEVLTGAEIAARAAGYTLLFATSHRDPEREMEAAQLLVGRQVDGLLVISSRTAGRYSLLQRRGVHQSAVQHARQPEPIARATADEAHLPVVLVNNEQPGPHIYSVRMDNRSGAAEAVAYLRDLGHRHIAYLAGPGAGRSNQERLEGYRLGLLAGSEELAAYVIPGSGRLEDGPRALAVMLALPKRPTAILCYNDLAAIGLLAAAHAANVRVPHDLSVVGYDNIPISAFTIPPLTTIRQPSQLMGEKAVNLCLAALAGEPAAGVVLTGELVKRATTSPPAMA